MKNNALFRCAKLSTLSNTDIKKLEEINLHAIIDFRDPKEIKKAPDNLSSKLEKKYVNLIKCNSIAPSKNLISQDMRVVKNF